MSGSSNLFSKSRFEAFSDGVLAVIITIMVLDLKAPRSAEPLALAKLWPSFAIYLVSFFLVMVYWINHHGLVMQARRITSGLQWANGAVLFSTSLIPFATAYVSETHLAPFPTAVYAGLQCLCGITFTVMFRLIEKQRDDKAFRQIAIIQRRWNLVAVTVYAASAVVALFSPIIATALFSVISLAYVVPRFPERRADT